MLLPGEFDILATLYIMACAVAIFFRRLEIRRTIRRERDRDYQWDRRIVSDKTYLLLDLTVLLWGVLAPGVFVIYGFVGNYAGEWWLPFLVDVPASVAGLFFASYLQVIRWGNDANKDVVAAKDINDAVFILTFFFGWVWPFFSFVVGSAYSGASFDLVSMVVMVGTPAILLLFFISVAERAKNW